ncbi:MAG: MFS transporter [Acidobacteriota bacterium]|nr:MFS transporter [Acidobacteriota bacterium]
MASQRWNVEQVGIVLTCGGLAGVLAQTPGGALVDRTHKKRLLIACGVAVLVGASLMLATRPTFLVVVGAQILLGGIGAILGPTVTAITLGMVAASLFDRRFGRNQTFNSAGNVAAALLMGAVGYTISNRAIFFAVPFLAVPCLLALWTINPKDVDYARARGARSDGEEARTAGIRTLISNRPLLAFAICAVLFHFANAAMLPQLGEMLAHGRVKESAVFMSACVVVTQFVIAITAVSIGKRAAVWGRKPLLLIGFGALPIRGVLYTLTTSVPLLIGIQLLDGVANAIFRVVSILVVADLTRGTGRFNVTQGALGAAVGIGASLSTTFAGYLVQHASYSVSFLSLAGIGVLAWVLLWAIVPETLPPATA